jgi:hypothetical protein
MPEQIKINQITATGTASNSTFLRGDGTWNTPAAGGRHETKFISLTGGSADKTTGAYSFVVGPVMIELLVDNPQNNNGIDVYSVLWTNMRAFTGTKTDNVTNRWARGPGNGGFLRMQLDRTTSGTVINISQPFSGTETAPDGTGIASMTALNWPNPGTLRVTAWEDVQ